MLEVSFESLLTCAVKHIPVDGTGALHLKMPIVDALDLDV